MSFVEIPYRAINWLFKNSWCHTSYIIHVQRDNQRLFSENLPDDISSSRDSQDPYIYKKHCHPGMDCPVALCISFKTHQKKKIGKNYNIVLLLVQATFRRYSDNLSQSFQQSAIYFRKLSAISTPWLRKQQKHFRIIATNFH